MSKLTASSVFGLVAVPPTPDATPVRAARAGHARAKKQLVGALLVAVVSGIAFAAMALAATHAISTSQPHDSATAPRHRLNVPVFCGTDRVSQSCILHALRPLGRPPTAATGVF